MGREVSIAITAKDNFSTAINNMRNANQSFNKDLSGLQLKLDELNKTKESLKVDTDKWTNSVQYTACLNIGPVSGLNGRTWKKHGRLPYIDYTAQLQVSEPVTAPPQEITAKLSTITAIINGKQTKLTSILHNNENYIRIRDLADAQLDDNLRVDWDAVNNNVIIES